MNWAVIDDSKFAPIHRRKGSKWVRVIAHIRNNATGEVRKYESEEILDDGADAPGTYIWEDGNYACDCNRELFFDRAAGIEPGDTECGDDRYDVNLENPATGEIFYREYPTP